jgi:hypothetical protein
MSKQYDLHLSSRRIMELESWMSTMLTKNLHHNDIP